MFLELVGLLLVSIIIALIISAFIMNNKKLIIISEINKRRNTLESIYRNIVGFTGIFIVILIIQIYELFANGKNITEFLLAFVVWMFILIINIQRIKMLEENIIEI